MSEYTRYIGAHLGRSWGANSAHIQSSATSLVRNSALPRRYAEGAQLAHTTSNRAEAAKAGLLAFKVY